jgi:hypothetical protein
MDSIASGRPLNRFATQWFVRILIALVLFGTVVAAVFYVRSIPDWYQGSDEAIIEINTLHAIRGLSSDSVAGVWLYGPYSRYGWRHPGPLYFYMLAPVYAAGGLGTPALKLGVYLINLSAIFWIAWLLGRHVAPVPRMVLMAVIALFAVRTAVGMQSVWNPHAITLPFLLSLVLGAVVAGGRPRYLPGLALATSFVTQTNVALVPETAAVVITSIVLLYRHLTDDERRGPADAMRIMGPSLGCAVFVCVVIWAPVVFEQLHSKHGNLSRLVAFFGDDRRHGQYAIDAWRAWADSLSSFLRWRTAVPWGSPLVLTKGWPASLLAVGTLVALQDARSRWVSQEHPVLRSLATILVVGSIVALWSCTRIEDEINDHNVSWISVLGVLAVGTLGGLAASWLFGRIRRLAQVQITRIARGVVIACVVVAAVAGALAFRNQRLAAEERVRLDPVLPQLVSGLRRYMIKWDIKRPELDIRGQWGHATGVLLNLYRQGQRLAVNESWEFMFGPPFRQSGTEDRTFEIALRTNHQELAGRAGDVEVAASGETCIHSIEPQQPSLPRGR